MKRYGIFAYSCYYPCGGMSDFIADFDTIDEAKAGMWEKHDDDYRTPAQEDIAYIYDFKRKERVWEKP